MEVCRDRRTFSYCLNTPVRFDQVYKVGFGSLFSLGSVIVTTTDGLNDDYDLCGHSGRVSSFGGSTRVGIDGSISKSVTKFGTQNPIKHYVFN